MTENYDEVFIRTDITHAFSDNPVGFYADVNKFKISLAGNGYFAGGAGVSGDPYLVADKYHLANVATNKDLEDGIILDEFQAGYKMNEKVILSAIINI